MEEGNSVVDAVNSRVVLSTFQCRQVFLDGVHTFVHTAEGEGDSVASYSGEAVQDDLLIT